MIPCPNCGGGVKFDIASQQMLCEYCNSSFNPHDYDEKEKDGIEVKDFDATIFTCPQCGGEVYSTDETAAGFCSFCGASTILFSQMCKQKRPDYIIPFKYTKEQCKQAYAETMKKAIFAPKELKDPAYIDGFRGIYMPYWAFYISQRGPISLSGEKSHRSGDYIIEDTYSLSGDMDCYYKGLSYDASASYSDNLSETLAPYDVKGMESFSPGYLSGFYADTADVDESVYIDEAMAFAYENTSSQITHVKEFSGISVNTSGLTPDRLHTRKEKSDYAMFPVWFLSYRNKDRVAYATVNGQNGKVVADIPIDTKKYLLGSLLLAIPFFIIISLFFTFMPSTLVVLVGILTVITGIIYLSDRSKIKKNDSYENDKGYRTKYQPTPSEAAASAKSAKPTSKGAICSIVGLILGVITLIIGPAYDFIYYGVAVLMLVAVFLMLTDVINAYNILSTRKLPQFDHKGGDDRA